MRYKNLFSASAGGDDVVAVDFYRFRTDEYGCIAAHNEQRCDLDQLPRDVHSCWDHYCARIYPGMKDMAGLDRNLRTLAHLRLKTSYLFHGIIIHGWQAGRAQNGGHHVSFRKNTVLEWA